MSNRSSPQAGFNVGRQHVSVDIVVEINEENQSILRACFPDVVAERKAEIAEAFRGMDQDQDGFLGADDIRCALRRMSVCLDETEMEEFVRMGDLDKDGMISLADFTKMMMGESRQNTLLSLRSGLNTRQATGLSSQSARKTPKS